VDGGVSLRLSPRSSINAVVRNLLDEAYYASAGPRWVYAPGRHGSVTLAIGF